MAGGLTFAANGATVIIAGGDRLRIPEPPLRGANLSRSLIFIIAGIGSIIAAGDGTFIVAGGGRPHLWFRSSLLSRCTGEPGTRRRGTSLKHFIFNTEIAGDKYTHPMTLRLDKDMGRTEDL